MTQVIDFIGGEYQNRTSVHGFASRVDFGLSVFLRAGMFQVARLSGCLSDHEKALILRDLRDETREFPPDFRFCALKQIHVLPSNHNCRSKARPLPERIASDRQRCVFSCNFA